MDLGKSGYRYLGFGHVHTVQIGFRRPAPTLHASTRNFHELRYHGVVRNHGRLRPLKLA